MNNKINSFCIIIIGLFTECVLGVDDAIIHLCPSAHTLRVSKYMPSVIGLGLASSIEIEAPSLKGGVMLTGRLHYSFSRTFAQIRKEIKNTSFLPGLTVFNHDTKTVECCYSIGKSLMVRLKNQEEDILVCPRLEEFSVRYPNNYREVKKIHTKNSMITERLVKALENGKKVDADKEEVYGEQALIADDSESFIDSRNVDSVNYVFPLELDGFTATIISTDRNKLVIEKLLPSFVLTGMRYEKKDKKMVVSCQYSNPSIGKKVTATREVSQGCRFIQGTLPQEDIVVCKRMIVESE